MKLENSIKTDLLKKTHRRSLEGYIVNYYSKFLKKFFLFKNIIYIYLFNLKIYLLKLIYLFSIII